jgi:acetylornithine deacetylase/succinyl-diaminopimelate desuccinylase-like protein
MVMGTRDGAVASALAFFDAGKFRDRLCELVAIPSTLQEAGHEADVRRYLEGAIGPWLRRMGFSVRVHPNPVPGLGPILMGERIEDAARPTVLTYGHGDTVRGLDEQWDAGLKPWVLTEAGDRWYGRGTADNKGQHALNLTALEHVLQARGGRLGFNVKIVLETSEERGSTGLREFVAGHAEALKADVLIASDGPRVASHMPTISTGTRGSFHFDLVLRLRPGGVHSGNWGGMIVDPAIVLAHAIGAICDRHGKILVRSWLAKGVFPGPVRAVLAGCQMVTEGEAATIDPDWGEPGLTAAEKIYGWTSFIVLALLSGRPENPLNAVAPDAWAHCQIRYTVDSDPTQFEPALRAHLDAAGFPEIAIERAGIRMPASRTNPDDPWVGFVKASMERTLGRRVQVIPNAGGGLPGDVFVDHLHVPLVWIPHSYNGCKQHGPNEHLLIAPAREGLAAYAGIWWDLGDKA